MNRYRPPTLSMTTRPSGVVVITIDGDLDTAGTTDLEPAFQAALSDRTVTAIIDLSGVPFLTSRALAMLVVKAQAMNKAGGALLLAGLTRLVREIFERAGFVHLFPIYLSVDEAAATVEKKKK